MNYGMETQFCDLGIHPKYPFIHLFKLIGAGSFPDELLKLLWYFCHGFYVAIEAHTGFLYSHLERLGKFPYSQDFNKSSYGSTVLLHAKTGSKLSSRNI